MFAETNSQKAQITMKSILLLGALAAVPLAFTGCGSTYVGVDGGPGYYGPGYYNGGAGVVDVGYYGYDRGGYSHHNSGRYDNSYHSSVASRETHTSRATSSGRVASASHTAGASHASASASTGGGMSGGHR
jgi:hypothetical protein